jgi:phosphonate transport system permease protein
MTTGEPPRRFPTWRTHLNARTGLLLVLAVAFAVSVRHRDLFGEKLLNADGGRLFREFFAAALHPTLRSEADAAMDLAAGLREAVVNTIAVAFAAVGLAIVFGFFLGCLASDAFWDRDPVVVLSPAARISRAAGRRFVLAGTRTFMAVLRSVHELVWALLLTSMFRVHLLFGILALAIPFTASYGRIFAEILDETPRDGARALRSLGAGDGAIFLYGLLPRAMPSLLSYTFYRFDCAVRSSAVVGWVGMPTLGLAIKQSFNELYFREVWTYLYVLGAILIVTETASGYVRRRVRA